jgi:hypothetical protein
MERAQWVLTPEPQERRLTVGPLKQGDRTPL